MDRVVVFDTTLRDGEQSPGFSMNIEEKLKMARQLERLNVDIIEAGFPIASDGDFEAVRRVAQEVRTPVIAGLARANRADIARCWEAIQYAARPRIHTFIATSDIHLRHKLRRSREEVLRQAVDAVRYAKSLTEDIEFSAEDAGRSDIEYLSQVIEAVVEAGATVVNIPDTVGYCIPGEFGALVRALRERVRGLARATLSVHCHNDLGLAVSNSLAAIQNGARQVECTINGIGERAGNASLEEIVMALRVRSAYLKCETGVRSEEIYRSSHLLSNLTGMPVQANKAIVGKNAFAHEAGIHQDGVLKEALTYEIMTPQSVGIPENKLVLGKHSGRHALLKRYESLGYTLTKEHLDRAYLLFTKLADKKKAIFDEELIVILDDGLKHVPESYSLKYLQTIGGNEGFGSATIKLAHGEEVLADSAVGDGPVDATYNAIDRITGMPGKLLDYSLKSVTRGKDAVAEAFVHVQFGTHNFTGKAASTDVTEASARAYLNAINKALFERQRREKSLQVNAGSAEVFESPPAGEDHAADWAV
ncbi:MAG: 2-isopropylmalate synthase [Acidobacteriia bacterium]|nr:2-isopropylmalate synthase [Terriglobia bacterium]